MYSTPPFRRRGSQIRGRVHHHLNMQQVSCRFTRRVRAAAPGERMTTKSPIAETPVADWPIGRGAFTGCALAAGNDLPCKNSWGAFKYDSCLSDSTVFDEKRPNLVRLEADLHGSSFRLQTASRKKTGALFLELALFRRIPRMARAMRPFQIQCVVSLSRRGSKLADSANESNLG
jgi:hypothetical protein